MAARLTQEVIKALADASAQLRLTQDVVKALADGNPKLKLTQVVVKVLASTASGTVYAGQASGTLELTGTGYPTWAPVVTAKGALLIGGGGFPTFHPAQAGAVGLLELNGAGAPVIGFSGGAAGTLELSADIRNDSPAGDVECLSGDGVEPLSSRRLSAGYLY